MAVEHPEFAYDTQNGWVDPARDELAGGSREWYAVQHWAAVHDGTVSAGVIPVDNPIVAFGDVVRGAWPREFVPKSATILSWSMSNYWSTNFKSSQGGEFTFRYAFVSGGKFEPAELTRSGWEQMTPLESDAVPASLTPSAVHSAGFLALDNANVVLSDMEARGRWTWQHTAADRDRRTDGDAALEHSTFADRRSVVEMLATGRQYPGVDGTRWQSCDEMKPFEILTLRTGDAAGENAMSFRFDGKVALVTGGAMGIGAATAQLLGELGASVAILDLDAARGEATVAEIQQQGHRSAFYACDVGSAEAVNDAVQQAEARFGAVHLLVSNAGIQRYGDVVSTSVEQWDETLRVHVQGCFLTVRAAVPAMLRAGGGALVVTGSVQTYTAVQNSVAYVTAKHALLGIVRSVALDYAPRGIRANCVLPGYDRYANVALGGCGRA